MTAATDFFAWAVHTPLYGLGMIVGLALGVFYGFDGWRGATEEVALKDSPRVKNLLWVVTGAFATIFGDVKSVDPSVNRPLLLLGYSTAVLVGASVVVLGWGVIVAVDNRGAKRRFGLDYRQIDALGDYFFFGYLRYRECKASAIDNQQKNFLQEYLIQLAYSIAAAGSHFTHETQLPLARDILRSMVAVVRNYRSRMNAGQVRANLMLVRDCTPELSQRLRFHASGATVHKCLELVTYDNDNENRDLVLPLVQPGSADCILPGAPQALLGEVAFIVDDTRQIAYPPAMTEEVKARMEQYFESKRSAFKSFASLRVVGGGKPVAVVNIDCADEYVFGSSDDDKKEIVEYLLPICSALGILLGGSRG